MRIVLSLVSFLLAVSAFSQPQPYAPPRFADSLERIRKIEAAKPVIDRLYKEYAEKNHFPGMVYGVMADGKLLYTGSMGYTDIEKKITATPSSAFRIASMTKSFTALAILRLRDLGQLGLDEPITKYIPEFRKAGSLTSDGGPVTVRHLLNHAAGFPEDNPWGDRQLGDTEKELTDLVSGNVSFSNVPGLSYEYSNLGYALLGRIITNRGKKPYGDYIAEHIFKPLGMNNTYWDYRQVPPEKLAHGYRWINGKWSKEPLLAHGSWGAMGGLITSIEDFARYMALHMAAWPPRDNEEKQPVLRRASLREMQTQGIFTAMNPRFRYPDGRLCPTVGLYAYGLGWTRDCDGKTWIGHSGGLPGFGSQWRFYPELGIGVVCFANRTYAPIGGINTVVLDTLIKMADLRPRSLPASPILQQRRTELVKLLPTWKDAEKSGLFAESFFPDNPIETLRSDAARIFQKIGAIRKIGEPVPQNQLRGTFTIEGEKGSAEVFFTLTPERVPLIQEYHITERK